VAPSDALLPEFDQEMAGVRKTLARVPADKFDWRPHEKSGSMMWLAGHIANLAGWASMTISTDELLAIFDKNVGEARAAVAGATDETLMQPWTLLHKGLTTFSMPRTAIIRSFVMNHLIHHRAQLGVYLHLNDVPVPSIYGTSADEDPFA
jgi:uncharacterized damage-inducible protein DinB